MGYLKALEILPADIIQQIQEYVDGEAIYIPRIKESKRAWGTSTNTKVFLDNRNKNVYEDYLAGMSFTQLAKKYFLVEKSIQRIIRQEKSKM